MRCDRKKIAGVVLAASLAALLPNVAAAQEHLSPDDPLHEAPEAYQKDVRVALREAYADDVIARVIVEPSFSGEFAIGLRKEGETTSIFSVRLKDASVWNFESRASIRVEALDCDVSKRKDCAAFQDFAKSIPEDIRDMAVDRCSTPIPNALASDIESAWRISLLHAAEGGDTRSGRDGADFFFAMKDENKLLLGKVWSPGDATLPGRLVSLAMNLDDLCRGNNSVTISTVAAEAENLVAELKEKQ